MSYRRTDRVFNLVLPAYSDYTEDRIRLDFALGKSGDIIQIKDTFVVEDSLVDIASGIKSLVPGSHLVGTDPTTIFVRWEGEGIETGGLVECTKYGGRSSESFRGVVEIVVCGAPGDANAVMAKIEGLHKRHRQSKLRLWYMGKEEPRSAEILLDTFGDYAPEFYPWLESDYFDRYLASSASILFMAGPPGTGKTSALRHMITSRGLHVASAYDEKVLASDAMFLDFIMSTRVNMLVIEDADNILTARSRGENALISRFLNFSDGLAKFRNKKIVFSTNLSDFGTVDPALTRRGRCFGALYARALTRAEAVRAAQVAGVDLPAEGGEVTIAEIFNHREQSVEPSRIGFLARV
jgi:hypothetical protein